MSFALLESPSIDSLEWRLPSSQRETQSDHAPNSWSLRTLFGVYRSRLLVTYVLFNVENLVALGTPWALGSAIDGLLRSWPPGLLIFAVQQLLFLALGTARRTYDARVFARIYSDLATRLVLDQRGRDVEICASRRVRPCRGKSSVSLSGTFPVHCRRPTRRPAGS